MERGKEVVSQDKGKKEGKEGKEVYGEESGKPPDVHLAIPRPNTLSFKIAG